MNGTIYWILNERVSGEGKILSLDLENEEFATICCPEAYLGPPCGMGGYCKALGYVPWDDHVGVISIWSSEDWILFYNIRDNSIERVNNLVVRGSELHCLYFDSLFSLQSYIELV